MTTRSGRQYTPYYPLVHIVPMAPPKWALEKIFDPLDLTNIQGGLHDLPKDVDSWILTFSGEIGKLGPLVTHIGLNYVKAMSSINRGKNILTHL
jgi:hypothetical protein